MKAFHITPCTKLAFVLLILVASFLTLPAPAYALCCGWETQIDYFADAAKTQFCGSCFTDCSGFQWCDGQTGPYHTIYRTCCGPCLP